MVKRKKGVKMTRRKMKSPKGLREFVRQLILERHENPPKASDTLRHGLFYSLQPRIESWARDRGIDLDEYNETHKQNFGIATYKTLSSVLSKMVLNGETSYERLKIIETERHHEEATSPDCPIELWFEKNGLMPIFKPIKVGFNISLWATKGFQSSNILEQMVARLRKRTVKVVLLITDFDPSGLCIPEDIKRRAKQLGIKTKFIRIGVSPEQIPPERRNPRLSLVQLKKKDSRYKKFVRKYGTGSACEVTSLNKQELRKLVIDALVEHGADIIIAAEKRHKENQRKLARRISASLLYTLQRRVIRSAHRKIAEYDTRTLTAEDLVNRVINTEDEEFNILEDSEELIDRVFEETKEEFGITDEDLADNDDDGEDE